MKQIKKILLIIFLLIPINIFALRSDYVDLARKVNNAEESDLLTIYLYYGEGCSYCKREKEFLNLLETKYENQIRILKYESWSNDTNNQNLLKLKKYFGYEETSNVPFTIIGNKTHMGFSDEIANQIEKDVMYYLEIKKEEKTIEEDKIETIPIFGEINLINDQKIETIVNIGIIESFSYLLITIILLLVFFNISQKKKSIVIGSSFYLTSFLILIVNSFTNTNKINEEFLFIILLLVISFFGIYIIYKYIKDHDICLSSTLSALIIILGLVFTLYKIETHNNYLDIFNKFLNINAIPKGQKTIYKIVFDLIQVLIPYTIFIFLEIISFITKNKKIYKLISGILIIIMVIFIILFRNILFIF